MHKPYTKPTLNLHLTYTETTLYLHSSMSTPTQHYAIFLLFSCPYTIGKRMINTPFSRKPHHKEGGKSRETRIFARSKNYSLMK